MMPEKLKVVSFNVNGILNQIKRTKILTKMRRENVDIIYLQETHLNDLEHRKLTKYGYTKLYYSSYKGKHKRGVAILISRKIHFEQSYEYKDKEGRFILVKGKVNGNVYTFFNVYAPPGSDASFFTDIMDLIVNHSEGTLICGGDFNIHLQPNLDISSPNNSNKKMNNKFGKLIKTIGLIDIWREIYPTARQYTFFSNPHLVYTRIDYFFIFKKDRSKIVEVDIGTIDLSDHAPIYITIDLDEKRRNTLWKFNATLLNDFQFKKRMSEEVLRYIKENDNGETSPPIIWDAAKAVLRGKIIAAASAKKRERQKKLQEYQDRLKLLENKHAQNKNPQILQEIKKIRNEINDLTSQEIMKKMLFTKQKYYESGSKFSKVLAWKLRKQQADRTIFKIRDNQKNTITKQENIQSIFESFYKKIFSKMTEDKEDEINSFLKTLNLPVMTKEQNDKLGAEITTLEIQNAIKRLKNNKSPGSDGFTSEWYKAFKEVLVPLLLTTFNWALKKSEIPPSWKEAIISLIPKEGKDRLECGSYRPISILNVDYRIYTSIMSKRMENILPTLINNDQTGFISKRQTQDNIRRTLHIMNHIQKYKEKAMLISLDAEKAFDSVNWFYLFKVLKKFQMSELIINNIKALYNNASSRIRINGYLTDPLTLERGVRQGCAWSPLLFAMYLEPLAQHIRQTKEISGITINKMEHKIACYADDIILFLSKPEKSIPELMRFLNNIGPLTGYKLNIDKTEIISYWYPSESFKKKYPFKWQTTSLKYLGVILHKDITKILEKNYNPLFSNVKKDIEKWNLIPYFSLTARIETIKMNILPRFLYLFQTLPVYIPNNLFAEWDKTISRFIWQGQRPRIRFKTLQLSKERGGWGLPSLKNYFISSQVKTLLYWCDSKYMAKWKDIECYEGSDVPLPALLADNKRLESIDDLENIWVKTTLTIWKELIKTYTLDKEVKIISWLAYDKNFKPNSIDTRFRIWIAKGIKVFFQIVKDNQFESFDTLQDKYHLEKEDFYRYLQTRHYYNQDIKQNNHQYNLLVEIFIKAYKSELPRGVISMLYKSITNLNNHSTKYIKHRWELEAGLIITDEEWEHICTNQWKSTSSHIWKEFCWKSISRYFIPPSQSVHFTHGNAQCWRNCGCQRAHHYHVFWECSILQSYWSDVNKALKHIFQINIPPDFKTMFLTYKTLPMQSIDGYLWNVLLAAAKKAITKKWMIQKAPTVQDWAQIISDIYKMEKITFIVNLKLDLFVKHWNKWEKYAKQHMLETI